MGIKKTKNKNPPTQSRVDTKDCNVPLIPCQHVVTMVRLTSGSIRGTTVCKITKEVFLFRSGKCSVVRLCPSKGSTSRKICVNWSISKGHQ